MLFQKHSLPSDFEMFGASFGVLDVLIYVISLMSKLRRLSCLLIVDASPPVGFVYCFA